MTRTFFALGALLAGLGVAAGAFGAHALQARIPADRLDTWEIAVRYQVYHGLALLALAWATDRWPAAGIQAGAWLLVAGTFIFAATLYTIALGGPRWLGAITPVGGLCLIAGWLLTAWRVWRAG
ncbi:MAG: DUF423 domain-containing protein [Gemmatimonadetes bacterium]|nr:DUF423 domain-containing protein [Gemmatimonadota bacterium]